MGNESYEKIKQKIIGWCKKLYQDGTYSYNQYQSCVDSLESENNELNRSVSNNHDENKNLEKIYGYYKKDKEKLNTDTSNPNRPIIEDDLQKMTLFHSTKNSYLISDNAGILSLAINFTDFSDKEWQLVSLKAKSETNVFAIMSKYGKFIVAYDDGTVKADSDVLSTWCQWKMIKYNNNFAFKSVIHKKFLAPVGQELILVDGWADNNLWVVDKKLVNTGKHLIKFDDVELVKQKDDLLSRYYTAYHNYIDYKYEVLYYRKKKNKLK